MLNVRPLTLTSAVENVEHLGRVLVEQSPLRAEDTLLIHSVSGRNAITIDVALAAKACGAKVIAITSLATAARVTSRHSSGKLLVDVADITIDNHCEYGDAAVSLPGMAQKPRRSPPLWARPSPTAWYYVFAKSCWKMRARRPFSPAQT
jgi:uncharacterized phosphosugar-binding protein